MLLLQERDARTNLRNPNTWRPSLFLDHQFINALTTNGIGYNYNAVRRWRRLKKTNIFELDKFTAIINISGNHWALLVAYVQLRTITCIDPKGSERPSYTCALKNFFQDEETNRLGSITTEWEIVPPPANFPQQGSDNNECGMFVCKYCKLIAENLPLNFTILDLSRMEIGMEIIHGVILIPQ